MREHPILFSAEMVKAILDGRKTQTRRVIKNIPDDARLIYACGTFSLEIDGEFQRLAQCPYGYIGDRLWVRETFKYTDFDLRDAGKLPHRCEVEYKLNGIRKWVTATTDTQILIPDQWRPSIFMPRWASRITLEITDIRVHKVDEITEQDAIAEGFKADDFAPQCITARCRFAQTWDGINEKRGYGWKPNLWVWAITFKVVK